MRQLAQSHVPVLASPLRTRRNLALAGVIAMLAAFAAATVLIVVQSDSGSDRPSVVLPAARDLPPGVRYDGGPEEGIAAVGSRTASSAPAARYDGGPEEGTALVRPHAPTTRSNPAPGIRYDGGPNEGGSGPFAGR